MPLLIRTARPDDYPVITSIHNAQNEPDFHTTPKRLRASDERSARNDPAFRRLIAEVNGSAIAAGYVRSSGLNRGSSCRFRTVGEARYA